MKARSCLIIVAVMAILPARAGAETAQPGVLISEVQTGNAARADEFIELHNPTAAPIDLAGWQLRYLTAESGSLKTPADPTALIKLVPPAVVPAGGYYLLYSGAVLLPAGASGQSYTALLPATGGSLVLFKPDQAACRLTVQDAVAWGGTTHLFGEGQALAPGSASANDKLYQRYVQAGGAYADTGVNAADFGAADAAAQPPVATPALPNTQLLPAQPLPGSGVASQVLPAYINDSGCTLPKPPQAPPEPPAPAPKESPPSVGQPPAEEPGGRPQPSIPASNLGLKAPLLSEFLPNPASPATDKNDEFIELYNANSAGFDLSGYRLEVGLKTKKRYVFPAGTKLDPQSFRAFLSADTKLALANNGSRVSLVDPLGRVLVTSQAYAAAKDGQAWVLADGKWQWTVKPTPGSLNIVSAPPAKKTALSQAKNSLDTAAATEVNGQAVAMVGTAKDGPKAAAKAAPDTPLHPGILALVAGSALLYGAYEYRHDLANKFHQFRSNRAARRAARQSAEGR